jgi:hypothetical protein
LHVGRERTRRNTAQRWQHDVVDTAVTSARDVDAILVDAVHHLAAKQRECIVLRHYARLCDSQVAREVGGTVGSTRTHLRRATARLNGLITMLHGEAPAPEAMLRRAFVNHADRPVSAADRDALCDALARHDRV